MKNFAYLFFLLSFLILGCKLSGGDNTANKSLVNTAATATPSASSTATPAGESSSANSAGKVVRNPTQKDFVGRYVKTIMSYNNVIELRENGTGALIINEGTKDEARGTFNWKVDFNDAVFTIREPVVNKKVIDSGEMTVRAQLIDGGEKLQTDYDLMFRARGNDVFERK